MSREFTIGVNDEGSRFVCSVYFGHDSGGITKRDLAIVIDYLNQPDVLGERIESLTFESKTGDHTTVYGSDLEAVRIARNALLQRPGGDFAESIA